jgi:hypothetical protein
MIQTFYPTIEKPLHINVLDMVLREIIGAPGIIPTIN